MTPDGPACLAQDLGCYVRSREGSTLRVKFELDEATVMKLRPVVEKLAYTRAA